MRAIRLSLPGLLLAAATAVAQPGAAPPANPDPMLEGTLAGWEKAMTELTSFAAKCTRVRVDKSINFAETFEGPAYFVKSTGPKDHSRAYLELKNKKKPEVFEKYVCSGTFLYQYSPANKVIFVHDMPQLKAGQVAEDNFLQFLFGMKAVEAKNRYQITYVPAKDAEQSKYYHFLRILPRLPQDKADFSEARLVLSAGTFLPRQLWYLQPNSDEISWDFTEVQKNINIPLQYFEVRNLPEGWQMRRAEPRNPPPPTVVRPQQDR